MSPTRTATTPARRCTRFVAWARTWRAGIVSYDDVADEIAGAEEHLVSDAPGTWTEVPLRVALGSLSRLHPDEIRLVLPAPGDPRGLPGPGEFAAAAMAAGQGVVAGQLGFVPQVRQHVSGSGDAFETVVWQVYPLGGAAASASPAVFSPPGQDRSGRIVNQLTPLGGRHDEPSAAEAEADLSQALAEATAELTRLDVAAWRPELASALAALRRPSSDTDLPPGFSPRARRLFARASVLDRVLALAEEVAPGGAVNTYEAQRRGAALRPLMMACRRALMAACNSPLEA